MQTVVEKQQQPMDVFCLQADNLVYAHVIRKVD